MNIKALIKSWAASTNIVEWFGGAKFNGPVSMASGRLTSVLSVVVYGPAPVIDASLGNDFVMTITNATALVVAAPTNPPASGSQVIRFTVKNASGGAHGALTWNAVFKTQATAFSAVADGFNRTVQFRWDGTNWCELVRTAADVAN